MRVALVILLLAGCGRYDFTAVGGKEPIDAPTDPDAADAADVRPDASGLCTEGDARVELNGACYSRFDTPRSYLDAAAACASIGAHLATFTTTTEADVALELFLGRSWIGLSDRDLPGSFVWQTGEPFVYTRWAPAEPSGDGQCAEVDIAGNWNDRDCATQQAYFCERSLATPPCVEGDIHLEFGGHCYWRIAVPRVTYADAVTTCVAAGGHPPVITSQGETDALVTLFDDWAYIGLRDLPNPGTFEWDTGEPLVYTNWVPGEPNSIGTEECAHIWNTGEWNNSICDYLAETMCERP